MITLVMLVAALVAIGLSYDVRRWVRDRRPARTPRPAAPTAESNLRLSDAMRDAIRRDVSAAIDRDARTAWACRVMAFHASGHRVRKATIAELMPSVVEVDR